MRIPAGCSVIMLLVTDFRLIEIAIDIIKNAIGIHLLWWLCGTYDRLRMIIAINAERNEQIT